MGRQTTVTKWRRQHRPWLSAWRLPPPTLGELGQVQEGLNKMVVAARIGQWRNLTVKDATLNTLVGLEIMFCFFIGEVLGRGSLIGYHIPGAVHYVAEI